MTDSQAATIDTSTGAVAATTLGAAADVSKANSSATASINSMPTAVAAPANDFKSLLGDLGEDPAFKDFKDVNGLAKSYKETKSLVGQKLGIPGPDATAEAKAAFSKALGVPDTAEGYGFEAPAELPAEMKEAYAAELKELSVWAKENGLTAVQAKAFQDKGNAIMFDTIKEAAAAKATADAAAAKDEEKFDAIATKLYGDKKAEKLQATRAGIEEHVPAEFRAGLPNWTTEQLLVFSKYADGLSIKYNGKEDKTISKDGAPVGGQTDAQKKAKRMEMMARPEYTNPMILGKAGHDALVKEVQALY